MPPSDKLYEAYVIAGKRLTAVYDACEDRGMSWLEIANDVTYREAVADSKKTQSFEIFSYLESW